MKRPLSASRSASSAAFTRVDLTCLLAALAALAFVVGPSLAGTQPRSHRLICANNLRQIGLAMQLWSHSHEDQPMFEVSTNAGGTRLHVLAPNAWLHFSWISNELVSPQWLLCPSDTGRPARDFSADPAGGYVHPNFANRATSYFLSHAFNPSPAALAAGDRNVGFDATSSCSRFQNVARVTVRPAVSSSFRWTNGLHEAAGNVLHLDGSVEQLSNTGLARSVFDAGADNGNFHFITPR